MYRNVKIYVGEMNELLLYGKKYYLKILRFIIQFDWAHKKSFTYMYNILSIIKVVFTSILLLNIILRLSSILSINFTKFLAGDLVKE